jgi:flagellar hook-associated protein FlgK
MTDTPAAGAGILSALGAGAISGVTQNSANAFGANDNGGANALLKMFGASVGVPQLQTTSGAAAVAAPGTYSIALPAGVNNVSVGDVLTVDAQPGGGAPQENVIVSAVSFAGGVESITATFANAHAAGFSITSAQTQTLGQYYGQLVGQMGVDAQTAIAGAQAQTNLSQNIDKVRQGVDGINIDEETQNLIKYQNAYQAVARTMNVMDSLLNTVVNNLGVH